MMFTPPSSTLLDLERAKEIFTTNTPPIPAVTDLVGYAALLNFIRREGIDRMEGDFLKIGCFLDGGTVKLARLAQITKKLVWMIDVFEPTANTNGDRIVELCHGYLRSSGKEEIIQAVTKPWADRSRVIKEDSRKASSPDRTLLAFACGDCNHDPILVKNDFQFDLEPSPAGRMGRIPRLWRRPPGGYRVHRSR